MYKTNFYMIIRRLLFLLFIVAVHIPAEAQVKNINITVRRTEDLNSKDAAPWPGVIVYGFFNASKANAFMKKCQEEEAKGMTYAPQSESEYDGRKVMMQAGLRYQLLYPTIILSFVTIAFYLIGNAFSDAADPKNHMQ